MVEIVVFWVECIGAIAFALSGILVAIDKRADVVGAFVLSLTTAFGGGVIRDLLLGITPPHLLIEKETQLQALIALILSMLCYHLAFFRKTAAIIDRHKNDFLFNLLDAIGLGVFCVVGINVAIEAGYQNNTVLLLFMGCLTGVGGGILRDIFAAKIPMVFRKHVYLLPALAGSLLYVLLLPIAGELPAMLVSISLIILIRILAILFKWNLPTPKKEE
jgi:uncharacterized membrane protein YeiH